MASHSKGYKYLVTASLSHELGKILDEKNKKFGIIKSFEIEQALRRYYGLEILDKPEQTYDR